MSSGLIIDSEYDSYSNFMLAPPLNYSDWNGHEITWRDLPEVRSEMERRILEIYNSGNHVLAYQLATLYLQRISPRYEIQLVKSSKPGIFDSEDQLNQFIQYSQEFHDRLIEETNTILAEVGLIDPPPPLDPISETNYPALWAYQVYCLENGIALSPPKTHSGGFKEFWKEHKKGIIIAAVVIVVAVTITVVIVTTAGTGTNVAVATGAAAAQAAIDSYNSPEDSDPNIQNLQHASPVNEGIQNFAKTIGATDVNHTNGPITIIETSIIPEVTPEILTALITDWNKNLAPVIETNRPSSLSIEPVSIFNDLSNELSSLSTPIILPQQLSINQNQGSIDPFFYPSTNSPSSIDIDQRINKLPWTEEEISPPKISGESTLIAKAKELGSCVVHQILDGAATLVSVVPQALEEIGTIGAKILPESMPLTNFDGESVDPIKAYESTVETLHEWIDELFSTNQAELYTEEGKNARDQFAIGVLPFPSDIRLSVDQFNKIANVLRLEKQVSTWLGEGTSFIRNEAGDFVFISKDGLRKVRFDFNKTFPHDNPHAHVEIKVDGKWVKSDPIYPTDVPHN